MLKPASHISVPPYLAVTVGPRSHSPPPTADAAITTPGPISASTFLHPNLGASINSPVVHLGICLDPGHGASKSFPTSDFSINSRSITTFQKNNTLAASNTLLLNTEPQSHRVTENLAIKFLFPISPFLNSLSVSLRLCDSVL